jgi:hypothetical protein
MGFVQSGVGKTLPAGERKAGMDVLSKDQVDSISALDSPVCVAADGAGDGRFGGRNYHPADR